MAEEGFSYNAYTVSTISNDIDNPLQYHFKLEKYFSALIRKVL